MTTFRLATLERLRTTALEERGQELHTASLALADGRAKCATLAQSLSGASAPAFATPDAVTRAAYYRDRLRADLAAAAADVARLEAELEAARQAWLDARAKLKAVSVLHERHRAELRAEQARRDQAELDDLAGSRRHAAAATAAEREQ
jgi:flagellar FliJ protein